MVVTQSSGLAAPEIEQRITYPIETALMGTPGAEEVRSISKFGLSMVTVVFEDAVPVYLARQLVTERVNEVRSRIPPGAEPTLGPVATAFGEIYQYLVEGDDASVMTRKTLHDWSVRNRLRAVPGVSEINTWGGLTEQFHVIVDPQRLERYGIDLPQVIDALADNNLSFSGGFLERRAERTTVRGVGLLTGHADIEAVVITAVDGVPVLVRDVAEVRTGPMPRQGAVTRDGRGETRGRHGDHAQGRERPRRRRAGEAAHRGDPAIAAGGRHDGALLRPDRRDRSHLGDRARATCSRARSWSSPCCSSSCATSARR